MPDSWMAAVRTRLFGISLDEARLETRGFRSTTPEKQQRLENAGRAFIHGYLVALKSADARQTASDCDGLSPQLRGFAHEGGAMGLAIIDLVTRGRPRLFRSFVEGPAITHKYMAHVGAGWALARCPWGRLTFAPHLDPLLKWLAIDGLGFHEGFFHGATESGRGRPSRKRRAGPEAFDNGLGRALWFATGARAGLVTQTIGAFPSERQAALWSGIGLAVTYAGGASPSELEEIQAAAGRNRHELALGSAFAAKARLLAENPTDDTARACRALCDMDVESAAALTDECLTQVPAPYGPDAYWRWRHVIKSKFDRRQSG